LHRLGAVTAVVWNGAPEAAAAQAACALPQFDMHLAGERFEALADPQQTCAAGTLRGKRLYAIAGIGDPGRFFRQLEALGLAFEAHPFSDHHRYCAADLAFARDGVLLMTEKDAVKCAALALGEAWVLPVDANVLPRPSQLPGNTGLLETILEKLDGRTFA
jgi:tetraacyldisaccharide 4'-kinase